MASHDHPRVSRAQSTFAAGTRWTLGTKVPATACPAAIHLGGVDRPSTPPGGSQNQPGEVVFVVGVTVQGIEAEVFAGVFEVVLLPPPVAHPVGGLGGGQVGPVGQDRGLVPVGAASDDQPQRQRAGYGLSLI